MDKISKEKRSWTMAQVKSKDTKPEMKVRKWLHHNGFRYRLHDKRYPGKPDIVLPKYKCIVNINGCYWHGHDCKNFRFPKSNTEYWKNKINGNINRDKKNNSLLKELGFKVITVWECELKKDNFEARMEELIKEITENSEVERI